MEIGTRTQHQGYIYRIRGRRPDGEVHEQFSTRKQQVRAIVIVLRGRGYDVRVSRASRSHWHDMSPTANLGFPASPYDEW